MTFSSFAQMLKGFADGKVTNGDFVLDLIDESLEDVTEEDAKSVIEKNGCLSYNPLNSEESARKYFDGGRKISLQNFETIGRHYERNKFIIFLKKLLKTDDNYRHLVLRLKEYGIESTVDVVESECADIFDAIIASADEEYKKPHKRVSIKDAEQEAFKDFVYGVFQRLVEQENWSFKSPKYEIFKNKLYELVRENVDERFDIAIENYNGENPSPSMKLLIACKKSNAAITKAELSLFESKVGQVPGSCKALFVTNGSLEEDALHFAIRTGIGVLRIFDKDKIKWLAPRKMDEPTTYVEVEKSEAEIEKALLRGDYEILNNFAVGCFGKRYGSVSALFNKIFTGDDYSRIDNASLCAKEGASPKTDKLNFIGAERLREIARAVRRDIYGEKEAETMRVDLSDLIVYLKKRFGFNVDFPYGEAACTLPQKIRGLVDYQNKRIMIYGIHTADLHLLKFSIAHEISHLILHRPLLERGKDPFFYFCEAAKAARRMETQANILASYITLHDTAFKEEFMKLVAAHDLRPRSDYYMYLDNQPCNIGQFMQITDALVKIFDVSRKQIEYRLLELGWLKTPSRSTLAY